MNKLDNILSEVKQTCIDVLGDNLIGIYVHGSIALGCFRWNVSDIDYIVVVKEPPTISEKYSLLEKTVQLSCKSTPKGIEMSVVTEDNCNNFVYPTPYELHYGNDWYDKATNRPHEICERTSATDRDLAAHFTVINHKGIVLHGKPISDVFEPIPRQLYFKSILFDVENAREDIIPAFTYVTLNLCRVLAALKEDAVLSKEEGGLWGLKNLPEKHHSIINLALSNYRNGDNDSPSQSSCIDFANEMLKDIQTRVDF